MNLPLLKKSSPPKADELAPTSKSKSRNLLKRLGKKRIIALVLVCALGVCAWGRFFGTRNGPDPAANPTYTTAAVERRDITSAITGSGSLEAANSYSVTALVEGTILTADFEEGDTVEEGTVLYTIDSSDSSSSLELSLKNIVSSKTRTLLTMLGIIIGVAAVIVIVGLGNGLEGYVTESFSSLGINTLAVSVQSRGSTRSMEVEDMYDIVSENSAYLDLCSPTASMMGAVKVGSETTSTSISGVSEDYLSIKNYAVAKGRNLQYSDILNRPKVCVVGAYVDQAYFGGNSVGQTLRVGSSTLTVVGVIEQQSDTLEEGGSDDFYPVISMSEMLETMTSMISILVYVLAGIAAISLVVGGIGILLGYGLSAAASKVVTKVMEASLTVAPTFGAVLLAFGISVGIGVLFGYLPAKKAAALNPIDALHYD